ncbi:MAG TPA: hypothetical protein PK271_04870 [Hyphomicrobium sp.]|uniref:hypothetical protein n=1 Tax=Hyphomicrobium sp. TaxID=82 RepID=UPI002D00A264|nr:hypothetical protein [Hyphomicrobium sp.]HRN87913.1 hypothetical protein [Hyphomicrobium sp.]
MTQQATDAAARKRTERTLVFIVVFLGLLIVAGIVAVVLRIIYLSSQPAAQQAALPAVAAEEAADAARLALPTGAVVKSISLAGDRLAIHYEAAGGAGIAVVDVASGAIVRQIDVVSDGSRL